MSSIVLMAEEEAWHCLAENGRSRITAGSAASCNFTCPTPATGARPNWDRSAGSGWWGPAYAYIVCAGMAFGLYRLLQLPLGHEPDRGRRSLFLLLRDLARDEAQKPCSVSPTRRQRGDGLPGCHGFLGSNGRDVVTLDDTIAIDVQADPVLATIVSQREVASSCIKTAVEHGSSPIGR